MGFFVSSYLFGVCGIFHLGRVPIGLAINQEKAKLRTGSSRHEMAISLVHTKYW